LLGEATILEEDIVYIPTSKDLKFYECVSDAHVRFSYLPPVSSTVQNTSQENNKREYKQLASWNLNYNPYSGRASQPKYYQNSLLSFSCDNCYATMELGIEFEFDYSVIWGVKNIKLAMMGACKFNAEYNLEV
jgi:hypothetical protein